MDGSAISNASSMSTLDTDMIKIMTIAVITVFLIVMLSTTSYLHPVVMLLTIGVAIALNMGTNIFRGTISSITQLVASVLQLAVSMDYSIVLLTNFGRYRQKTDDQFEAMVKAMTKSFWLHLVRGRHVLRLPVALGHAVPYRPGHGHRALQRASCARSSR